MRLPRRSSFVLFVLVLVLAAVVDTPAVGIDRPFNTSRMVVRPNVDAVVGKVAPGITGGGFSKTQIERFSCTSSGDPTRVVDMSCNTEEFGQRWAPDNEIAVAVNPEDPKHVVAGSNDYFYRFNNATGARQAIVPTGFFTSFDGGKTWTDGQIPMRFGNGAGDPVPAFDAAHGTVLMAQLENIAGLGGFYVARGDVSVSRSEDGGLTWTEPVTVFKGQGAGIGPAKNAKFFDKEWLTVDNNPGSPNYGRAYLTATLFENGLQGAYIESPIFLSHSDDGGATWSPPREISGSNPDVCTYQETGPAGECDEDQFSIPEVAPDGTLHVHFLNAQNEAEWETAFDFDSQIMVTTSIDGGVTFSSPVPAAQLEDGLTDMPWSVIGRQTIWGHQLRWTSAGTITADPTNADNLVVVWSDRGTANPNAAFTCLLELPGAAPDYDPCEAGPSSDTDVWYSASTDGGDTWSDRDLLSDGGGAHQWFPWADHTPDGQLVAAWDQDDQPAGGEDPANDTFHHVYWDGSDIEVLGTTDGYTEHIDRSVTHWAGQYVPRPDWPAVCGPNRYDDPGTPEQGDEGKDCNVFHGDYTGLQVDSLGRAHITWTGLNRFGTSPQIDPYTGDLHDGYVQDAMYARR